MKQGDFHTNWIWSKKWFFTSMKRFVKSKPKNKASLLNITSWMNFAKKIIRVRKHISALSKLLNYPNNIEIRYRFSKKMYLTRKVCPPWRLRMKFVKLFWNYDHLNSWTMKTRRIHLKEKNYSKFIWIVWRES